MCRRDASWRLCAGHPRVCRAPLSPVDQPAHSPPPSFGHESGGFFDKGTQRMSIQRDSTERPSDSPRTSLHPLDIPSADSHPGIGLYFPEDAQIAADAGHQDAERWLKRKKPGHLWTQLVHGRAQQNSPIQQAAYELGFLMRLQQRLGHQ